jgi:hypothetical protein
MARSGARRVSGALADWTGRSDDELRLALTVAGAAAALFAGLRFVEWLANHGETLGRRAGR